MSKTMTSEEIKKINAMFAKREADQAAKRIKREPRHAAAEVLARQMGLSNKEPAPELSGAAKTILDQLRT